MCIFPQCFAKWKNGFFLLFKTHGVKNVRQTEINVAEPLVPEPSTFEVEITIARLERYKLSDIDQVRQNLSKQEVKHCIL
jgi:hypothetical protein